ncbi:hypothetical protein B0H17DRAFT_924060 [Mycena rosella]|uniref:Uncharacterized protein n=1 Tax=Mycena rosella TaxID=1033263 RepID=A0AAD7GMP8_MYCRO|nr:hypothetical protein B0H17DRAFT_924060 [Mycena rosella]
MPPTTPGLSSTAVVHSPTLPTCPEDAPEWVDFALQAISKEPLGECFNALIALWMALEQGYGYKNPGKGLAATTCPKEVSTWIGSGRGRHGGSGANGPIFATMASAAAFGESWWKWWRTFQPKWRTIMNSYMWLRHDQRRELATAADWAALRHPGPNSIFLLVLTLYWWGRAFCEDDQREGLDTSRDIWTEAVKDLTWMVHGLVEAETAAVAGQGETEQESDQLWSS